MLKVTQLHMPAVEKVYVRTYVSAPVDMCTTSFVADETFEAETFYNYLLSLLRELLLIPCTEFATAVTH